MTAIDWTTFILAALGALSWLPIAYKYYSDKKTKTCIDIYLDKSIAIIENEFNVFISTRIGLHIKFKDAFIDKMTIEIEHSNGETRVFHWIQIVEHVTQTQVNETIMPTDKILNAIGYKLSKDSYTEPILNFINLEFRNKFDTLMAAIRTQRFYILQSKSDLRQLETNEHFIDMQNVYKKYFSWTSGDYKANLIISTSDNRNLKNPSNFILTN